jgi:hypothetical protein
MQCGAAASAAGVPTREAPTESMTAAEITEPLVITTLRAVHRAAANLAAAGTTYGTARPDPIWKSTRPIAP